jgi:hypothetical protein
MQFAVTEHAKLPAFEPVASFQDTMYAFADLIHDQDTLHVQVEQAAKATKKYLQWLIYQS